MDTQVLITDSGGTPRAWAGTEEGACYYARGKVLWEIGTTVKTYTGGHNYNGDLSKISVSSILGVSGPIFGTAFYNRETVYADRGILYGRDRYMCCYCGEIFLPYKLTIDHILPKSRGGKNTWMNTVASCKSCNTRKADRTPEEAKMHLLYVPYIPNMFEKMILKNRNILQDQMDFLINRVPKHSRLLIN